VKWAPIGIPCSGELLSQLRVFGIREPDSILATEVRDLARYLNTIVFLYRIIRDYDNASLNRIGSHPVGSFFALVRMAGHDNHSLDRFRGAVAKGILAGDLMAVQRLFSWGCQGNRPKPV
jgi:hypothetical protein